MTELDRALHTSVLKREAQKEKTQEEERRQREQHDDDVHLGMGGSEMTKEELRKVIDSDRRMYYRTEELNDKLYIHYKGWRRLQNLEGFTGLRALYAECNAFSRIEGLQNCGNLRSLFLQENCIKEIEGLENCPNLWSLNLSSNFVVRVRGLSSCKTLNTLQLAKNKIGFGGVADLEELVHSSVSCLDVQDNRISDPDVLPEVFMRMRDLRVLYLKGNEVCKRIPNYRKSITALCQSMRYIDDRPVFEDDRRTAVAFNRGGLPEEREERRRIKEEKDAAHRRNMEAFQEMIERSRAERRERDGMRMEDKYTDETDPVESNERRMKRLQEEDKKANPATYRDEMKEHAERTLKAEREERERLSGASAPGDTGAGAAASERAHPEPEGAPRQLEPEEVEGAKPEEEEAPGEKTVDNRKLVYEDIWGDAPQALPAPKAPTPSAAKASAGASAPAASAPEKAPAKFAPPPRVEAKAPAPPEPPKSAPALGGELDEMD